MEESLKNAIGKFKYSNKPRHIYTEGNYWNLLHGCGVTLDQLSTHSKKQLKESDIILIELTPELQQLLKVIYDNQ